MEGVTGEETEAAFRGGWAGAWDARDGNDCIGTAVGCGFDMTDVECCPLATSLLYEQFDPK